MRGMAEGKNFVASAQLKLPMAISNGTTIFQTQQIISEAPVSVYTGLNHGSLQKYFEIKIVWCYILSS